MTNNAQRIEEYEKKIYYLTQLVEIGKGLNSSLEYNVLIESILLTCMGQLKVLNAGMFLLKDLESREFILHRNYKGFDLDHNMIYSLPIDSKLVNYIGQEIRCYSSEELLPNVDAESHEILDKLKPEIIVPLQSKGEINGIIFLGERIDNEKVTEIESEYLLGIASLASIAINNSRLYEMATTDMMTKLKMHHYFQTVLSKEMELSRKYNRALSLIMIDIDHFKNFNDSYGHTAGDKILMHLANLIKSKIRVVDVAARYGGEEFALILPGTDIHEALIVAERARTAIEQKGIDYSGKELKITISVGLTQFDPDIDSDLNKLIDRADRALYNSKSSGRNMVSFL